MGNIEMMRKNNVLISLLTINCKYIDSQFVINTEEIDLKNPSKFEKSLGRVRLKIIYIKTFQILKQNQILKNFDFKTKFEKSPISLQTKIL